VTEGAGVTVAVTEGVAVTLLAGVAARVDVGKGVALAAVGSGLGRGGVPARQGAVLGAAWGGLCAADVAQRGALAVAAAGLVAAAGASMGIVGLEVSTVTRGGVTRGVFTRGVAGVVGTAVSVRARPAGRIPAAWSPCENQEVHTFAPGTKSRDILMQMIQNAMATINPLPRVPWFHRAINVSIIFYPVPSPYDTRQPGAIPLPDSSMRPHLFRRGSLLFRRYPRAA
jgi:hypothetical protein